jgi:enterochelin esterase-like enzyme
MVSSNRHLRTVLEAKGYDTWYSEYSGGHDYAGWQAALPQALMDLLGT